MASISKFTDDELSGIGIGPEHGPTKTRLNSLIDKVNGMDTPSEFPFTPTTATDWPDTPPTNVQNALDQLAAYDKSVVAEAAALDIKTDESEVTGDLNGKTGLAFIPQEVVLICTEATGTVAADGTINVGTTTDGAEILSGQALTGLDTAGAIRRIPLAEATYEIAADATLYVNVESAESTATTLVIKAQIAGRQVAY
jgi:hypothetical protein